MSLPAKPLPADDAALRTARRLDATAAGLVLVGWPMLMMVGFALGMPEAFLGLLSVVGIVVLVLGATGFAGLRRVKRRIVLRRLAGDESPVEKFAVECRINAFATTRDLGILWREGSLLRFEGTESEFAIPSDAVAAALPTLNDNWTVHIPLRRGHSVVQISLRGIAGDPARVPDLVETWASLQFYGGEESAARAMLRTPRLNPIYALAFIVPCVPLAVYAAAMSYTHPTLFIPCFAILAFGLWRWGSETRRLFEGL